MKANAPKRKVFNDAVDLLTGGEPATAGKGVQMLPVDGIRPFRNHPFHLYEGERLDDMVESVQEHGVLVPAIVRTVPGGYEMLAGHNRLNAARLAGLTEIPAIVKEDLPDVEAYVYVIETNMLQRSFNDLSVSERIAVLAERYDKVCGTKKREEILAELQALNGGGGHDVHQQAKSRELLGKELGLTGRHVARYVRCKELIPEFKDMLDNGSLTMVSAVELSYLPEEEQAAGSLSEGKAQEILGVDRPVKTDAEKPVSVKLPAKLYSRYFSNVAAKDVQGILEAAVEQYFKGKGA